MAIAELFVQIAFLSTLGQEFAGSPGGRGRNNEFLVRTLWGELECPNPWALALLLSDEDSSGLSPCD